MFDRNYIANFAITVKLQIFAAIYDCVFVIKAIFALQKFAILLQ